MLPKEKHPQLVTKKQCEISDTSLQHHVFNVYKILKVTFISINLTLQI